MDMLNQPTASTSRGRKYHDVFGPLNNVVTQPKILHEFGHVSGNQCMEIIVSRKKKGFVPTRDRGCVSYTVHSWKEFTINPNDWYSLPVGFRVRLPQDTVGLVEYLKFCGVPNMERLGLWTRPMTISPCDFDDIAITLENRTEWRMTIVRGQAIAEFVVGNTSVPQVRIVEEIPVDAIGSI